MSHHAEACQAHFTFPVGSDKILMPPNTPSYLRTSATTGLLPLRVALKIGVGVTPSFLRDATLKR